MAETKTKEVKTEPVKEEEKVETIAKVEYDRVVAEYNKLATAFNKLLREYNDLHVRTLFPETSK